MGRVTSTPKSITSKENFSDITHYYDPKFVTPLNFASKDSNEYMVKKKQNSASRFYRPREQNMVSSMDGWWPNSGLETIRSPKECGGISPILCRSWTQCVPTREIFGVFYLTKGRTILLAKPGPATIANNVLRPKKPGRQRKEATLNSDLLTEDHEYSNFVSRS